MKFFTPEEIKAKRMEIDAILQYVRKGGTDEEGPKTSEGLTVYLEAEYTALIKLKEAKMWLGVCLEGLGTPYPAELADKAPVVGTNTTNPAVEPSTVDSTNTNA